MVILRRDPAHRPRAAARPRRIKITPLRILILLAVLVIGIGGGGYALLKGWEPSRARYPVQGITISSANGPINWLATRGSGIDFAYLVATSGSTQRDASFATNLESAKAFGLTNGAIHRYSLCASATAQATAFIATVPRDAAMLPPVVALAFSPLCPARPSRDRLLAELNIFLNQIEAHGGKPAILRLSHEVEAAYDLSSGINRTLWLEGEFLPPGYAARPWVMWTASTWRRVPGIEGPIEWDVVRP